VFGVGDYRSSGLMAGVAVSLGLVGLLLLAGRPWRGRAGIGRWLSVIPALALGFIALVGLAMGLPDFLMASGLFVDVDGVGPRSVVAFGDGFVLVGDDGEQGFVWFSEDGSTWSASHDPVLTETAIRDVIVVDGDLIAFGASEDPTEAVILTSADGLMWEELGRFGNGEHGTSPKSISQFGARLVAVTDIIGNDVEFYSSLGPLSWHAAEPAGVFDDGEYGQDIGCSDTVCVAVGTHHAGYRPELAEDAGVAWVSTTGDRYDLVDQDFQAETLTAVAWNGPGFLAAGQDSSGRGVVWLSVDGRRWIPVPGPFNEMTIDGLVAADLGYLVFGHDPNSGAIFVWASGDGEQWDQQIVSEDAPLGSHIRSIAVGPGTRVAVGIDSKTLRPVVWMSIDGQTWRYNLTLDSAAAR
jgi:hypothetical protein